MFLNNKYTRWYNAIIERAKLSTIMGYSEKHHVIPRSLGGTNDKENIVRLKAREHFICHLLLIRMLSGNEKRKMIYAAWQQSRPSKNKSVKVTSRTYDYLREQMSISYTGIKKGPMSEDARKNMKGSPGNKNGMFGKKRTEDERSLMSKNRSGKCIGTENPFFGKTHSNEVSKILSAKNVSVFTGVPKLRVCCIHCKKEVSHNMINRYHGDNCKSRS